MLAPETLQNRRPVSSNSLTILSTRQGDDDTNPTDNVFIVRKMGFAFLAAEYLGRCKVDVIRETHSVLSFLPVLLRVPLVRRDPLKFLECKLHKSWASKYEMVSVCSREKEYMLEQRGTLCLGRSRLAVSGVTRRGRL